MRAFQPSQCIISGTQVKTPGALPHSQRRRDVVPLYLLSVLLNKSISVLGETARGRKEQSSMVGTFGEQALHEFQAERRGCFDQLRIVVRRENRPAASQRITEFVDSDMFD